MDSSKGFLAELYEVELTWGGLCTPSLGVHVFRPKGLESKLIQNIRSIYGENIHLVSLPVGISELSVSPVKEMYRDVLKTTLLDLRLEAGTIAGHKTVVSRTTLRIVLRYYDDTEHLVSSNTTFYLYAY
jgi:hypothetical protein